MATPAEIRDARKAIAAAERVAFAGIAAKAHAIVATLPPGSVVALELANLADRLDQPLAVASALDVANAATAIRLAVGELIPDREDEDDPEDA